MNKWSQLATDESIEKAKDALIQNGISVEVVDRGEDAKKKVLSQIPQGSEVMTMSSVTLQEIGLVDDINKPGKYDSVKNKLSKMDRATQNTEMRKLGSAPLYAVGSIHAATEDGKLIIASNTGSQLPAYIYGATHVIWVVGAQKIVTNVDEGIKRIYEYILPLESERMNKAYNMTRGSFVSKVLIINREIDKTRLNLIFVKEVLGF